MQRICTEHVLQKVNWAYRYAHLPFLKSTLHHRREVSHAYSNLAIRQGLKCVHNNTCFSGDAVRGRELEFIQVPLHTNLIWWERITIRTSLRFREVSSWSQGHQRIDQRINSWTEPQIYTLSYCSLLYPFLGNWGKLQRALTLELKLRVDHCQN